MNRSLVLASTSPRRRLLLEKMGVPFTVCAPTLQEEVLAPTLPLAQALEKLALAKARSVAAMMPDAVVLGADTIVCKDGKVLGKPANEQEAKEMLALLSGATHEVITAVALYCQAEQRAMTSHMVTQVQFRPLSDEDIADYIATGEPFDKAGGYGIQGEAGRFVAALTGDFDNVVGLPTEHVKAMLARWEEENL
ncbi:MAG: Maf family protein [Peptococcaceae bacterium]|nr:Maf family protein [Peptococcaceae bacterium]